MKQVAVFALVVAAAVAAHAQVFKCPGPNGRVIFSDAPCPGGERLDADAQRRAATERAAQQRSEREDLRLQLERLGLEREKVRLEQERTRLRSDQLKASRDAEPAPGAGSYIPPKTGVDSYACEVARRNVGVGANPESKARSQREYEVACFGDKAAEIEGKRQGRPQIYLAPGCRQIGTSVVCN